MIFIGKKIICLQIRWMVYVFRHFGIIYEHNIKATPSEAIKNDKKHTDPQYYYNFFFAIPTHIFHFHFKKNNCFDRTRTIYYKMINY